MFGWLWGRASDEELAMHAELIVRIKGEKLTGVVPQWMPKDCPLYRKGYKVIIAAGTSIMLTDSDEEKLGRIKSLCERFAAEKGRELLIAGDHRDDYLVYVGLTA
ncbi:MAG: hypothetical protein HYV25_01570 [Candidatus Harrisonbacteria bacterium]|nr:hypothetical protein [Candidatus Harrisonbacteria bacterium]